MDAKNSGEVLDRFYQVLYKQPAGGGLAAGDPICEPGEVIALKVSDVLGPIEHNTLLVLSNLGAKPPEVRLDEESELKLGALLMHMANSQADTDFGLWLKGRFSSGLRDMEEGKKAARYWERLGEYIKRQQIAHAEPERLVSALDELGEPESVPVLLDLLREVDPERAKAVEAALPPSPEAMQAELEALRRQVSKLEAERDALIKSQLP